MRNIVIIAIIINLVLIISMYALYQLIKRPDQENDRTSKLRFEFMMGIHVVFFVAMIIQLKVERMYD